VYSSARAVSYRPAGKKTAFYVFPFTFNAALCRLDDL
jgi:hypothetical protein